MRAWTKPLLSPFSPPPALVVPPRPPPPPGFFDATPYGGHPPVRDRLNERFRRIIEPNLAHIEGKRIVDLGSRFGSPMPSSMPNSRRCA